MSSAIRIGHITPSSNTVLEPLAYAMVQGLGGAIAHHFARISVMQVARTDASEQQFQMERFLAAANLLAEAPLDVIAWSGTAASWRGLEKDLALCEAIFSETHLPATTATIGFYNAFRRHNWTRIALAVPYTEDITGQIEAEYGRQGFVVTGAPHLGIRDNVGIGAVTPEQIRALLRDAAKSNPDCIAVVCTNLAAAGLVSEMEAELEIPIIDSVAVTVWEACRAGGYELSVPGWGYLLEGRNEIGSTGTFSGSITC